MIHSDQTGYLKGRYIEKAFGSIDHSFIEKVLNFFKFGKDLQHWIEVFYTDISSCVINNGDASPFSSICRGARQGCLLSPYLFIISIDLLAIRIRNNPDVKGIPIFKSGKAKEAKISLYADDTTLLLPGTEVRLLLFANFENAQG